jgi:hypothetical protein
MESKRKLKRRECLLLIAFVCAAALVGVSPDGITSAPASDEFAGIEYRRRLLCYYRAPDHPEIPQDLRDPYNMFRKNLSGELLILPTSMRGYSTVARSKMQAFRVKTHRGSPILIYQVSVVLRDQFHADCHGLTFLGGKFWLDNRDVDTVLKDGGWRNVDEEDVREGDIAIYRNESGRVVHSALVAERDTKGRILVLTKSGSHPREHNVWANKILVRDFDQFL